MTFETSDACPHGIRYLRGVNVCSVCLAQPGDRSGETPEQREVLDALGSILQALVGGDAALRLRARRGDL